MMKKLKVALICHVSNPQIRKHLPLSSRSLKNMIKRLLGKPFSGFSDYGFWNTLLFEEFKKFDDIELHAIIPHPGLKVKFQNFEINGIHYHCFNQTSSLFDKNYKKNRKCIHTILSEIKPDIVNLVGLEAPFYSLSVLDIDSHKIPIIVSMQTALSDPDFQKNYPLMDGKTYKFRSQIEQEILRHITYIASDSSWHRRIALTYNKNAIFVRYHFCASQTVPPPNKKIYDFVYWAANIEKAGEDAIRAFIFASKQSPGITLNVVGRYSEEFHKFLIELLDRHGLREQVVFSGYYPTHYDALCQVVKSKIALIPIKVDIVSTTIREAVFMKMPVVTYATKGTPSLNNDRQSVLISEIGDFEAMGKNMAKLLNSQELHNTLVGNALHFAELYWDNCRAMRMQANMYHAVYEHFHYGKSLPIEVTQPIY